MWKHDAENGVEDRVATQAYAVLGTAALFDEGNRYGGDFEERLESGWNEGEHALKENLKRLLS